MPFLFAASIYWHLPIMVVLVSLVYHATRYDEWPEIIHHSIRGGAYIVFFMGSVFLFLLFLSSVLPRIW